MDRKLSRAFVRVKDEETGQYASRDITDCTEAQIREVMADASSKHLLNWLVVICRAFKKMGDDCDINHMNDNEIDHIRMRNDNEMGHARWGSD
jgi:hypothetical protein